MTKTFPTERVWLEGGRLDAVIAQDPAAPGAGLLQIAGQALLARQLQWLRAHGCRLVAVELCTDDASAEMAAWLEENAEFRLHTTLVWTPRPLGPHAVLRRAGYTADRRYLVVPPDVIGDGDLMTLEKQGVGGVLARMSPPPGLPWARGGAVRLVEPGTETQPREVVDGPGWAVRVTSPLDALRLSAAILSGELPGAGGDHLWPVQVHAAQVQPGVFLARGAAIEPGAIVRPPILLNAGALVRAGAEVGPAVILGERAVVETGARLREAVVDPGVIVGEKVVAERCAVHAEGVRPLDGGEGVPVADELALAPRNKEVVTGFGARTVALLGLLLLAPLCLCFWILRGRFWTRTRSGRGPRAVALHDGTSGTWMDLVPRLLDVVRGERPLVGMGSESQRPGALQVELALTNPAEDSGFRRRVRDWYHTRKSIWMDVRLLLARLRGRRLDG